MTSTAPNRCTSGFGPSALPDRSADCKICHVEIEENEASITHNVDPCKTTYHSECLLAWLPHAAHVPSAGDTGKKEPSCPNCRSSLGMTDLSNSDDEDEDVEYGHVNLDQSGDDFVPAALRLPPNSYPIESLDELRRIVGDEEFTRLPLADRRSVWPVRYNQIPVENWDEIPPIATATAQSAAAAVDFSDFVQTSGNFMPSHPAVDILQLFPRTPPTASSVVPEDGATLPSASTVNQHFRHLFRTQGVTSYEAFYFPIPSFHETAFYLPIHPFIHPLPSLTALRDLTYSRRVFADPSTPGRWLREPATRSMDPIRPYPGILLDRIASFALSHGHVLDSWAIWLPNDIERTNVLYAVPRVVTDISARMGEEGEIEIGFLCADGSVDTRAYWARELETQEELDEVMAELGDTFDLHRHQEIERVLYDAAFEREMLDPTTQGENPLDGVNGEWRLEQLMEAAAEEEQREEAGQTGTVQWRPHDPTLTADAPLTPNSAALVATPGAFANGAAQGLPTIEEEMDMDI